MTMNFLLSDELLESRLPTNFHLVLTFPCKSEIFELCNVLLGETSTSTADVAAGSTFAVYAPHFQN